jgi:excinuclease UvrABC nuclease subunit
MEENLNLKDLPNESGVYWFISNDEIVYVGSSKNLKIRFSKHLDSIRKKDSIKCQKELYQFLAKNPFTVEFKITEEYRQLEQKMIDEYNPKFNQYRAYTGLDASNELQYYKDWHNQYKEHHLNLMKKYTNQLCYYDKKVMSLNALRIKLKKDGFDHPCLEAKKYIIPNNVVEAVKNVAGALELLYKAVDCINK